MRGDAVAISSIVFDRKGRLVKEVADAPRRIVRILVKEHTAVGCKAEVCFLGCLCDARDMHNKHETYVIGMTDIVSFVCPTLALANM